MKRYWLSLVIALTATVFMMWQNGAFAEKPKPWTDGGGTGFMVRSLVELARAGG